MKKAKSTKPTNSILATERQRDAAQLEMQRLAIQRELEEAMEEYASVTGYKKLKERKHKVGTAPNDWRKR